MAVDESRQHYLNFFTDFNLTNPNIPAITTSLNSDSLLFPFYNLNDVIFHQLSGTGKLSPAVKDDSGVTFNNSFVPPPTTTTTTNFRKRQREQISSVASPLLTMNSAVNGGVVNRDKDSGGFSFLGEDLSLQITQQQLEIDRLISQHMEKMRMGVEERKKQQVRRIMAAIEESLGRRLRDKEEEIDKIGKINWTLEERVKSLCLENQIWRDLAQSNEATANALRTNLEQILQQVKNNNNVVDYHHNHELTDDAVSCCGSNGCGDDERENEKDDEQQQWRKKRMLLCEQDKNDSKKGWIYRSKTNGNMCRECGEGESCVLLLPCRHLCLCTSCGSMVNICPICNSVKNASVHVNLSS